jgi:hypothetical protein
MVQERYHEAATALKEAIQYAPEVVEIRFWAGLHHLQAGFTEEGKTYLREVFRAEPIWRELVSRLVAVGLFPNDPALLREIEQL